MRLRSALTMVRAQRSGSGPDTQTAMRLVKALAAMAALHSVMFYLWSRLPVGVSMASHKARLLRAVVVLTGLLTLLGDVGDANAATMITTPETHDFTVFAEISEFVASKHQRELSYIQSGVGNPYGRGLFN